MTARPQAGVSQWTVALTLTLAVTVVTLADCTGPGARKTARPTLTTSTTAVPGAGNWTLSTTAILRMGEASGSLSAVLGPEEGAPGWVLAGTTEEADGGYQATVWRSADGRAWEPTMLQGTGLTRAFDLIRLPGGAMVVVGAEYEGASSRAAVWIVDDGAQTRVDGNKVFAGDDSVAMYDVVAGPAGLVATGVRSKRGWGARPAVWRSQDGTAWERTAADDLAPDGHPSLSSSVATASGVVLVGSIRRGAEIDAMAWFSPDGTAWETAPGPDFGGEGAQELNDVVATGTGLLAVGSRYDGQRAVPATWRSPDGRSWVPGSGDFELRDLGTDTFGTAVHEVVTTATGLMATGGGPVAERVWTSPDGERWSDLALPAEVESARGFNLELLASGAGDVVAASTAGGIPALFLLHDGAWSQVTAAPSGLPAPGASVCCVELAALGDTLVASVGTFRSTPAVGGERHDVQVFTSGDGGTSWAPGDNRPLSHVVLAGMVARPGGGVVAVGGRPYEPAYAEDGPVEFRAWTSGDGHTWTSEKLPPDTNDPYSTRFLSDVAARDNRVVAVGWSYGDDTDGVIFVKDGGAPIRAATATPGLGGPGNVMPRTACAGPSGFVAAGSVDVGPETDAAVWFSPDGDTWRSVPEPVFSGAGYQAIASCAAVGTGFVAVGYALAGDAADAAVWRSADGLSWSRLVVASLGGDDSQYIDVLWTDGEHLLAAGGDSRNGRNEVALWSSDDGGAGWVRLALGPEFRGKASQSVSGIAVGKGRIVLAGVVDNQVAIWSRPWPLNPRRPPLPSK